MSAVAPLLLASLAPVEDGLRGPIDTVRPALEEAGDRMAAAIGHHGAIKCAIDIALHDLAGKRLGMPVRDVLGVDGELPPTDFTLGIDTPAVVAERAIRAARLPGAQDQGRRAVGPRDPGGRPPCLRRARSAWTPTPPGRPRAPSPCCPALERLGVVLVEQPFPARRLDQLRWLQERSALPIVADESAVTIEDLDALVGVVAGVNVKLAKCGGVGPALRMLERARALGFRTFLGCMEETSIGIAASAAVSPLAEWVDLDGCLLLADDPVTGLEIGPDKRWILPDRPGLGLELRPEARP